MSLPGKLCIGILEEDNPLKAYFRFKPILVEEAGRYVPYADAGAYPGEGCIRIVPDKNEAYHFKGRMRHIGLFCVVDLRAHPDDNDKIRPNKNYAPEGPERNAFIIYSDVVREPAPGMIFEVLPEDQRHGTFPEPHTRRVMLRGEALQTECYPWEPLPGTEGRAQLLPTDSSLPTEHMQVFDLPGFRDRTLSFAILTPAHLERLSDAPAPRFPRAPLSDAAPAFQKPSPLGKVAAPQALTDEVPVAPAFQKPPLKMEAAPSGAGGVEPPALQKPSPLGKVAAPQALTDEVPVVPAPQGAPSATGGVEVPVAPAPQGAPDDSPKPWIHHDASMLPRPVDPRLSPAERNLAIQSGLNPRRGRSLQELIDEKWQQSRLNQLGQPVAPIQTGAPVSSPVDSAVEAVRRVWQQPNLRQDLLQSLGGIEEFGASLEECRAAAKQADIDAHLDSLEARRLALLSELDHLNLKSAETRKALKAELRRDADAELAEAVKRTDAARAEQAKYEQLAREAHDAARDARKAVEALTGEALEQQLTQFALSEHMLERIRVIKGEAEALPPAAPKLEVPELNALADRLERHFEAGGLPLSRMEALNLAVCAAVSPVLILSGPVGCGKTGTARLLAGALGWDGLGRSVTVAPGRGGLSEDARLAELKKLPGVPALVLLDDANLRPAADVLRGLGADADPVWRLCLTVQDGGFPLPAHALDRGFTLRLAPKADAPWRPLPRRALPPEAPASLEVPVPDAPLPAAIEERFAALRRALAENGAVLSRRALDDSWRYCGLMCAALGADADPVAILDRAVAQRILPALLASAPIPALAALPNALEGLPLSRALLSQPLPVMV